MRHYLEYRTISYLLLVDVGLRSFTSFGSFECPTRCRHRDTSQSSQLKAKSRTSYSFSEFLNIMIIGIVD